MRLILLTGKGGAGASTLAAATAVTLAGGGRRTLALGAGPGLAPAFGRPLAARAAAARSLDRIFPPRQPTMLDPFLRALSGAGDGEEVYERGRELLLRLSRLRRTLSDPESASLRLVPPPGQGPLWG